MPDLPKSDEQERSTFDPSIQTENIAYRAAQLRACSDCTRQNPPNRTNCIYCGAELAIAAGQLTGERVVIRKSEAWEQGFNIICRSGISSTDLPVRKIASLISLEPDEVEPILSSNLALPIARLESLKLAEILVAELGNLGFSGAIVNDADLAGDKPPVRLSKIEVSDAAFQLIDFNTRVPAEVAFEDLLLIVNGQLTRTRTDMVEKRNRKGAELLDEAASFTDETVIDLYTLNESRGFRIHLAGFDSRASDRKKASWRRKISNDSSYCSRTSLLTPVSIIIMLQSNAC